MSTKIQSSVKNNLRHHAYLIEGDPEVILPALFGRLETELGRPARGHPDIFLHRAAVFSIAESRQVKSEDRSRPVLAEYKIVILAADFFSPEAQNALLKVLEDAAPDTRYFLIAPQAEKLLPTLRSRLEKMNLDVGRLSRHPMSGEGFLALSLPERLAWVGKLVERHKNDDDSGPLKKEALEFLNDLEIALHEKMPRAPRAARGLENILRARDYLADRGAMVKMLLENLALVLPEK